MKSAFGSNALASVFMVAGALVLASCSTSSPSPRPEDQTSTGPAKPYGSLTIATVYGNRVNTKIIGGGEFQGLGAAVFDSLVELTPQGQVRPGIAERWEISSDGLTHTFYIRKGVRFHNGDDLTGADVKFSIERMLAPDATTLTVGTWRGAIASVELKDDYTVVLRMKQPQFELLVGVANLSGSAAIMPKKYIGEKGEDYFLSNPVGSGPFKVVKYEPGGTRVEIEAVENHWRAVPQFQKVIVLPQFEEATKVAMLKTGELDMADVTPDSANTLKAAGLRMLTNDGGSQAFGILFYDLDNPEKYALSNLGVRRALSLAINRQEMADKLFHGYAKPSAHARALPTAYFWDANVLKPDPYDPEVAKKLFAEAGYFNGFAMKMWDSGAGGIRSILTQAVSGYWQKIGVTTEIVPIELSAINGLYRPKHDPKLWPSVYWVSPGGAFQFEGMSAYYHSSKGTFKNLRNPRLDELIDKVPMTLDPAEKKKLALEAAVLSKNEYSILAALDLQTVFAVGPKVGGITITQGIMGLGPALETITHPK